MKLATVNPESNVDIEQILSKDVSTDQPFANKLLTFLLRCLAAVMNYLCFWEL